LHNISTLGIPNEFALPSLNENVGLRPTFSTLGIPNEFALPSLNENVQKSHSMEIQLTYRRTSRLSLRIGRRGDVRVSAPIGTPRDEVQRFVDDHRAWIDKALAETQKRLEKRNEFFDLLPLETPQQRQEVMQRMNEIILPLLKKYTALMGVKYNGLRYSKTISRWGCCNTVTKTIQLSVYLLLLPPWCIEHVVVHELAHLIVPNHSPRFYAVMDKFFPRWKEAREETKRISRMENDTL
jgi:predicted metal-dependent hydrolase